MLKIVVETVPGNGTLRAEGRLIGPWVDELKRSCEDVLIAGAKLSIDLSDVSFVDRDGVELLQSLRSRHVELVNCSSFVTEQLKGWAVEGGGARGR